MNGCEQVNVTCVSKTALIGHLSGPGCESAIGNGANHQPEMVVKWLNIRRKMTENMSMLYQPHPTQITDHMHVLQYACTCVHPGTQGNAGTQL